MKRTCVFCLVGLFLVVSVAWSQDTTEKAVAALEDQWLQSQKTNDAAGRQVHEYGSDGKLTTKAESLANARATKYDSVDYEDLKVSVFWGCGHRDR